MNDESARAQESRTPGERHRCLHQRKIILGREESGGRRFPLVWCQECGAIKFDSHIQELPGAPVSGWIYPETMEHQRFDRLVDRAETVEERLVAATRRWRTRQEAHLLKNQKDAALWLDEAARVHSTRAGLEIGCMARLLDNYADPLVVGDAAASVANHALMAADAYADRYTRSTTFELGRRELPDGGGR